MTEKNHLHLSRRERQIMDVLYSLGSATVTTVRGRLPDPPGYSAVRAMLSKLEEKGHIRHIVDGPRYLYLPSIPREKARQSAMQRLVDTFFDGSVEGAVTGLLGMSKESISADELERLAAVIHDARAEED